MCDEIQQSKVLRFPGYGSPLSGESSKDIMNEDNLKQ